MAKERPLITGYTDSHADSVTLYINREGAELLEQLLTRLRAQWTNGTSVREAAFENGQWHDVTLQVSVHAEFDCGSKPCTCGCQDKYKDIEAQYQEK